MQLVFLIKVVQINTENVRYMYQKQSLVYHILQSIGGNDHRSSFGQSANGLLGRRRSTSSWRRSDRGKSQGQSG